MHSLPSGEKHYHTSPHCIPPASLLVELLCKPPPRTCTLTTWTTAPAMPINNLTVIIGHAELGATPLGRRHAAHSLSAGIWCPAKRYDKRAPYTLRPWFGGAAWTAAPRRGRPFTQRALCYSTARHSALFMSASDWSSPYVFPLLWSGMDWHCLTTRAAAVGALIWQAAAPRACSLLL